ncbi:ATP-binding protein [Amycolatopsis suaedae]|uniref:ATP-binding protein n=1 Tax=Amycolatopsis suaedae TaxID=2510978 RepID=A0A4Q7J1R4_9PSEU|nr:ATP-binding protein [Amycolatopsis suaedae]
MRCAALRLPEAETGLALARRFTRETLRGWRLDDVVPDAELAVSELVSNALCHAHGEPRLRLSLTGRGVLVEVDDNSPVRPVVRTGGGDGGWGLRMISRLSLGWGATPLPHGGKTVWCELPETAGPLSA